MKKTKTAKRLMSLTMATAMLLTLFAFIPFPASAIGDGSTLISAGHQYTLMVTSDGSLWACGCNVVGDDTSTDSNSSIPVKIMEGVAQVSAGTYSSLAIKIDGSLWKLRTFVWIGPPDTGYWAVTSVKIMDEVAQVSEGDGYTMAVKKDGSLWAWGENKYGQLGDGTAEDRNEPVKIMDRVAQVSAGREHTMAIDRDGGLWAWGNNEHGQLGDGTAEDRNEPVKIMDDVIQVSAGGTHTLAIKSDGSLWAWGCDLSSAICGSLTDSESHGSHKDYYTPFKIHKFMDDTFTYQFMEDVVQISAGDGRTLAIKSDGSLWGWGSNSLGSLGIDYSYARSPVKIMDGVAQVSTGTYHTVALKKDGSFWAWGWNNMGQLGNGTALGLSDKGNNIPTEIIIPLDREPTPAATIDYVNERLTNLVSGATYSFKGGTSETLSGTFRAIDENWFGTTISIVKIGDGGTTSNSAAQSIGIKSRPATPRVGKIDCTTDKNNDGKLTGVSSAMEYQKSGDTAWKPITGNTVTGLSDGRYYVRIKAVEGTSFASLSITLTIVASTTPSNSEPTPAATIDYTNEKLTNLVSGGIYSFNGGANETLSGTSRVIEESWFGTTVSIVKKGKDAATDSAAQSLNIKGRPAAPTVGKTDCKTDKNNDGSLTGVSSAMEYQKSGDTAWKPITGSTVTGLSDGKYNVRIKAVEGQSFKSQNTVVTIAAYMSKTYEVKIASEGTGASGGGSYEKGDTVNISAGTPPKDKKFKNWTSSPGVAFADAKKPTTSFAMPEADITVTAVFEADSSAYTQNDRYSFSNSSSNFGGTYTVSDSDFAKLANYVRSIYGASEANSIINSLQEFRNKEWGGSCFGMASTSILDKRGQIDMRGMVSPPAATLWQMPRPRSDARIESAINYYQISQIIPAIKNSFDVPYGGELTLAQKFEGLVGNAKSGKLTNFNFWIPNWGGHAIVVFGYEPGPNGSHNVLAYDVNYPDKNTIVNVSADYTTCYVEPYKSKGAVSKTQYTASSAMFDQIKIDGVPGTQNGSTAMSTQLMIGGQTTTVTNAKGQTLTYNARTGEISGNIPLLSVNYLGGATVDGGLTPTVMIEVPSSDQFTFEAENRGLDVSVVAPGMYASAGSDRADKVVVEKDEGVTVTGSGTIDFTASLGLNSNVGDMVSIEGKADGEASLGYDASGGALAKGDFGKETTLTVFSDTTKVEEIKFTSESGEVLVTKDAGKIGVKDPSGGKVVNEPKKNPFTDVGEKDWFYKDVMYAYGVGLINGKSADKFAPVDNLTYAEAVKLAACMHQLHTTGSVTLAVGSGAWYQSYVDYAKKNKIINKDYDWTKAATRAGYMEIFANALPDSALAAVNSVADNSIPDVPASHPQAAAIYKLYRAGILQGVDAAHNCKPDSNIKRSEVAAILTRMMDPSTRVSFSLQAKAETPKQDPSPTQKLTGRYELVSMTFEGKTTTMADFVRDARDYYESIGEKFDASQFEGYIEFTDGTRCRMYMFGESEEGTYKVSGSTLEITTPDGDTLEMTLSGNRITVVFDNGDAYVFEKK